MVHLWGHRCPPYAGLQPLHSVALAAHITSNKARRHDFNRGKLLSHCDSLPVTQFGQNVIVLSAKTCLSVLDDD